MGNLSHINNGTHNWLPHFWPFIFTPYIIQAYFYQKLSPFFFHTVQNFGNFSLKDPYPAGIWEKGTQMPPIFMDFVTEKPPLHARVWREFCSLKHGQKLENVVFLKQLGIVQFGEYFEVQINKGDEN